LKSICFNIFKYIFWKYFYSYLYFLIFFESICICICICTQQRANIHICLWWTHYELTEKKQSENSDCHIQHRFKPFQINKVVKKMLTFRLTFKPAISARQRATLQKAAAQNRRSSEHPSSKSIRSNSTTNQNSSLASASSAPDLASQIRSRSGPPARPTSFPAKPGGTKSFGELLNPEAVDTDDEVNTNFSVQDKEKDKDKSMNNASQVNKSSTMSRVSSYQSSESSSDSKDTQNTKSKG